MSGYQSERREININIARARREEKEEKIHGKAKEYVYGEKRDYPKIDIFVLREYVATTTWARNCFEARQRYAQKNDISMLAITAHYASEGK